MIDLHNIELNKPHIFDRARVMRPWVQRTGPRQYRVVGRNLDHGKYNVTFHLIGGKRFGECDCPAGRCNIFCHHMATAYRRHLTNARNNYERRHASLIAA